MEIYPKEMQLEDLVTHFGGYAEARDAISTYRETRIAPTGTEEWDWDNILCRYYVPAWHLTTLIPKLVIAIAEGDPAERKRLADLISEVCRLTLNLNKGWI